MLIELTGAIADQGAVKCGSSYCVKESEIVEQVI